MSQLRRWGRLAISFCVSSVVVGQAARAQWVTYVDETAARLAGVPAELGIADPEEKDYTWADFDHDGDTDLAVARKEPFSTPGKRPATLWINENGVFTDRTADFASASTVAGDQGFLTPTNTRDIVAVDIDNDGWIDLVTGPAISPNDPKHIGHPRVYRNRGCLGECDGTDDWLGFRFENNRIPTMVSSQGQPGNPCLCAVAAGDVTGDGYADLWLIDYDTGEGCGGATDFNNKLLVNRGVLAPGVFDDVTNGAFFGSAPDGYFPGSAFGASGKIIDINADGKRDLVKQYASHVGGAVNDPFEPGLFDTYYAPPAGATYFMNTGDLNNDSLPDLILSDDGGDRYVLHQGVTSGMPDFLSFAFSFNHTGVGGPASDDGFGGTNIAADLNNDGWQDVLIADNDVDIPGCGRRMHIYRNLGGTPGGFVTLQEQTTGTNCMSFMGNPASCLVASIPANKLVGVFDVAPMDINGDGWLDLVVGRCSGTKVFINQPPFGPAGALDPSDAQSMLTVVNHLDSGRINLNWGDSCSTLDTAFNVYEGQLGEFQSHVPVTCNLDANSYNFIPATGNTYYLVVPTNGTFEGSYGLNSNHGQRQQGQAACDPQLLGTCD